MSSAGLEVFDKTLQTTHIWLNEIEDEIGPDHQNAWHALRVVLCALRDRLPMDEAAQLGAQLPIMIRGIYYDGWQPSKTPTKVRRQEDFLAGIQDGLRDTRPMDPKDVVRAVFKVLSEHVTQAEIDEVKSSLPKELQVLWPGGYGADGQASA